MEKEKGFKQTGKGSGNCKGLHVGRLLAGPELLSLCRECSVLNIVPHCVCKRLPWKVSH